MEKNFNFYTAELRSTSTISVHLIDGTTNLRIEIDQWYHEGSSFQRRSQQCTDKQSSRDVLPRLTRILNVLTWIIGIPNLLFRLIGIPNALSYVIGLI
ncbi:Pentafunctional AROM polypeptide [Dirofilaria immitis]